MPKNTPKLQRLLIKYRAELSAWNDRDPVARVSISECLIPLLSRFIVDLESLKKIDDNVSRIHSLKPLFDKTLPAEPKGDGKKKQTKKRTVSLGSIKCLTPAFIRDMEKKYPKVDVEFELSVYKDSVPNRKARVKNHQAAFRNHLRIGFRKGWCSLRVKKDRVIY